MVSESPLDDQEAPEGDGGRVDGPVGEDGVEVEGRDKVKVTGGDTVDTGGRDREVQVSLPPRVHVGPSYPPRASYVKQ